MSSLSRRLEFHWAEILKHANATLETAEKRFANALVAKGVDASAETRPVLVPAVVAQPPGLPDELPADTHAVRGSTFPPTYEYSHTVELCRDELDQSRLPISTVTKISEAVTYACAWKLRLLCFLAPELIPADPPLETASGLTVHALALKTPPDGWKARRPDGISAWTTELIDPGMDESASTVPALLLDAGVGPRLFVTRAWMLDWDIGGSSNAAGATLLISQRAVVHSSDRLFRSDFPPLPSSPPAVDGASAQPVTTDQSPATDATALQ